MRAPDQPPPGRAFEHVILAIDMTAPDVDAIAAAVEVAARWGAAVDAVLIEDINLFRFAALPIARQVSLHPVGATGTLDLAGLESELRAMSQRAQATLAAAARRLDLAWSLRTVRGEMPGALLETLSGRDLLVVNAAARATIPLGGLGLPLRSLAQLLDRSVLLLSGRTAPRHPMVVLEEGTKLLEPALAAALRLSANGARALDVALSSRGTPEGALADVVRLYLGAHGIAPRIVRIGPPTTGLIASVTAAAGSDIVVVTGDLSCIGKDGPEDLIARTARPVMIVR